MGVVASTFQVDILPAEGCPPKRWALHDGRPTFGRESRLRAGQRSAHPPVRDAIRWVV